MKRCFVTTFNKKLYEDYANKLLDSYLSTNQETPLVIYVEDDVSFYPKLKNVCYKELFIAEPGCLDFIERNRNRKVTSYLNDAVRFSYKVFAQVNSYSLAEEVFYVDSDCVFLSQIPATWFEECLPNDVFVSFYHRPNMYTETGFVAFNNTLPCASKFYRIYKSFYLQDTIYNLAEDGESMVKGTTDCHAFDETRGILGDDEGYREKHLGDQSNDHPMAKDPFINNLIDHRKGNRKALERSPEIINYKRKNIFHN